MAKSTRYPILQIDLKKIYENAKSFVDYCREKNISVSGVIKGFNGFPKVVDKFIEAGCTHIASSRLDQLIKLRKSGVACPLMLLRLPMLSELDRLVEYSDISLNSEIFTIEQIEKKCRKLNKEHSVVLMSDLGDLREGFFNSDELIKSALYIEKNLHYIKLKGIGTNLGCYGSIKPSCVNLNDLCTIADEIEQRIGRKLEIVSGGASSSLPLLLDGILPKGINNLRVGEAVLLNLPVVWNIPIPWLHRDAFILKAQVIEIKEKPSYPIGEQFIDAFGNSPEYTDKGIKKRALLAVGRQDFVMHDKLIPTLEGIEIVGSSSDHLIIDIENCKHCIKVGDVLEFGMYYVPMLYLSGSNDVKKVFCS